MVVVLWDADGNKEEVEYPIDKPEELDDTSEVSPGFRCQDLKERLCEIRGVDGIKAIRRLARNHYTVLDATDTNDTHWIIRIARVAKSEALSEEEVLIWSRDKVRREAEMMKWMSMSRKIPVPRVVAVNDGEAGLHAPYIITEKCSGKILVDAFGGLGNDIKEKNIQCYAEIALALFNTSTPPGIGSLLCLDKSTTDRNPKPLLGPCISTDARPAPKRFETIADYFKWLLVRKRTSSTIGAAAEDRETADRVLRDVEELILRHISNFEEELLRSVPSHDDFGAHNVFINNDGTIAGVIDWEFHSIKPVVLAVNYPDWIRYDGCSDPRFVDRGGQFSHFWVEGPKEAEILRRKYESIDIVKSNKYYRLALQKGAACRAAEEWLTRSIPDPGCRRLRAWLRDVLDKEKEDEKVQ